MAVTACFDVRGRSERLSACALSRFSQELCVFVFSECLGGFRGEFLALTSGGVPNAVCR